MTNPQFFTCDLCGKKRTERKEVPGDVAIYDGRTITTFPDVCSACAKKAKDVILQTFPANRIVSNHKETVAMQ